MISDFIERGCCIDTSTAASEELCSYSNGAMRRAKKGFLHVPVVQDREDVLRDMNEEQKNWHAKKSIDFVMDHFGCSKVQCVACEYVNSCHT